MWSNISIFKENKINNEIYYFCVLLNIQTPIYDLYLKHISDTNFSLGAFDLYLNFIKLTVKKIHIPKSFQIYSKVLQNLIENPK